MEHSTRARHPATIATVATPRPALHTAIIIVTTILALLLPLAGDASSLAELGQSGRAKGYNVLFVTLDTVRADHLGSYGHDTAETPTLDALCTPGIRYTQVIAPAPVTLPSHTTMMTGLEIPEHGARNNGTFTVDQNITTLAEVLAAGGYTTGAFVSAYVLDSRFGLDRGFQTYDDALAPDSDLGRLGHINRRSARSVTNAALSWLDVALAKGADHPFFAWVHYFDAHEPFNLPGTIATQFAGAPYDGAISFVDQQLARLLAYLEERNALSRTLIVVTADHGEGLGEHGERTHSRLIYDSTLHVPLILSCPTLFEDTIVVDDRVVGLCDLAPTLTDLVGVERMTTASGRHLLTSPADPDRAIYIETMVPLLNNGWASLHGLRRIGDKFIQAPQPEYFDLTSDPDELENLVITSPGQEVDLAGQLYALMSQWAPPETAIGLAHGMDPAEARRLAALGYVGSAGSKAGGPRPDPKDMIVPWEQSGQALSLSAEGRHQEAVQLIETSLRANPKDAQAWEHAALIQQRIGNMKQAQAAISQSIKLYPTSERYVKLARYYLIAGQLDPAERLLDRAQQLDERDGGIYVARGQLLCARGQFEAALVEFEQAKVIDPVMAGPAADDLIDKTRKYLAR